MSRSDDTQDVLHDFISGDDDDRLLAGHADIQDGELAGLASLFAALREPVRVNEAAGTKVLVAQMGKVVREGGSLTTSARRRPRVARLFTGKVAAVAALSLFSASAAAAATGNLPDPVQRDVSRVLSRVGVNVPTPNSKPDTPSTPTTGHTETSTPKGPDATGAAKHGLCTAYLADKANGKNPNAVAFKNLAQAAKDAGKETVEAYCAAAPEAGLVTTENQTKPVPAGNSGSTPAATAPGQQSPPGNSGSTPAVTAPGQQSIPGNSGSTPGATAPGQVSNPGNGKGTGATKSSASVSVPVTPQATRPSASTPPTSEHGKP